MDAVGLIVGQFVVVSFAGLVIWAAYSDFTSFIVPNRICLAVLGLYPSYVLSSPSPVDWPGGIAVGLIIFIVGFLFFVLRVTGGGDAKLLAAISIWAGTDLILPFLLVTAYAGGAISIFYVAHHLLRRPDSMAGQTAPAVGGSLGLRLSAMLKAHIPYGIAIASGGLFVAYRRFEGTVGS